MTEHTTRDRAHVEQRDIAALYDRLARIYDLWAALTESRACRRALEMARVGDGEDVLEVAVGTGRMFAALARANPSGTTRGVDLSSGMVAKARRRIQDLPGDIGLQVADAHALPFANDVFDLVVVEYLFDLLPEEDFPGVIAELRRVLRDGGRAVVVNMTIAERRRDNLYRSVYRLRPRLLGGCRGVRLSRSLDAAGFHVQHREYLTQLGFPSEIVVARGG